MVEQDFHFQPRGFDFKFNAAFSLRVSSTESSQPPGANGSCKPPVRDFSPNTRSCLDCGQRNGAVK